MAMKKMESQHQNGTPTNNPYLPLVSALFFTFQQLATLGSLKPCFFVLSNLCKFIVLFLRDYISPSFNHSSSFSLLSAPMCMHDAHVNKFCLFFLIHLSQSILQGLIWRTQDAQRKKSLFFPYTILETSLACNRGAKDKTTTFDRSKSWFAYKYLMPQQKQQAAL